MQLAVQWAVIHPAESIEEAETIGLRCFGDTGIPVAGPGAPLVAEFSVAEFAAAVGLGTEAGNATSGTPSSCATGSTGLWTRVVSGDLPAWRARRVADETLHLCMEAAGYVDQHLAPVAHKVSPAQIDRLITEAVARFMPEQAEEDRRRAWDQRRFNVDFDTVGIAGTCPVTGEVDLADAIDLNNAVTADAQAQADLGSALTLDQRRAVAIGNIARRDLVLDLPPVPGPAAHDDQASHGVVSAWCCTSTSPKRPSDAEARGSGGWRTPALRSPPRRSGPGAATRTRR